LRTAAGEVLLERRPPVGIWGGLWRLSRVPAGGGCGGLVPGAAGAGGGGRAAWNGLRHSFSHFHLDITPVPVGVAVERDGDGRGAICLV